MQSTEHFYFTGTTPAFVRLYFINLFLNILTLGIYAPFAKVRSRKFFYENLKLDDKEFKYIGRPVDILKYRIMILAPAALFLLFYFISQPPKFFLLVFFMILIVIVPVLVVKSVAFDTMHTVYDDQAFEFRGNYKAAYKILAAPLILAVVYLAAAFLLGQQYQYSGAISSYFSDLMDLFPFVLIVLYPVFEYKVVQYRIEHVAWDQSLFVFSGDVEKFFGFYIKALAGFIVCFGVIFSLFIGFEWAGEYVFRGHQALVTSLGFYSLMLFLPVFLFFFAYLSVRKSNLIFGSVRFRDNLFKSDLRVRRLLFLYVVSALAVIFSFGLLAPWAKIQLLKYRLSAVCLHKGV